ncbi:MAG: STAS-like domain-containing protein [Nanoarchaeota archaeon]|nr:STAS-like domain-containing protein [Nanoarchaeota archaeon]
MKTIRLLKLVGSFAENKDIARDIRIKDIVPALEKEEDITLDFEGVESATQSFIHALISDLIRRYGIEVLDKIIFKNCNDTVKKIISIVADYMQETD